ncbi:MAG: anti-phage dCTP deaminase [bacterium]
MNNNFKFIGSFEELKSKIGDMSDQGEWIDLNDNQKQFRHKSNKGILNWFPSTGTISFQGKQEGQLLLKDVFSRILNIENPVEENLSIINSISSEKTESMEASSYISDKSELVIGLVGAVGTNLKSIVGHLQERLNIFGYSSDEIRISKDIISSIVNIEYNESDEYDRISKLMDAGNLAREKSKDNSVLALGAVAEINKSRLKNEEDEPQPQPKKAYIINSLKHPEEVARLREIYSSGFFLVGVFADKKRRGNYLINEKRILNENVENLIARDEDEHLSHGQCTSETFHLSDFFIHIDESIDESQNKMKNSLNRILEILFGHPYKTPTFDEFAMFMAFSASLRSADLSRQVGTVIAKDEQILATGANDCPKCGGGLYWPFYDSKNFEIKDMEGGRDYKRGYDSNKEEQNSIISNIINEIKSECPDINLENLQKVLKKTKIKDITEYGRVVHAEMEALLSCSRSNISTKDATLYCTTFPCHNCAKHIIASGINRVVYVEPYPKSKAIEFHSDSIKFDFYGKNNSNNVCFEPFIGVGPRRFIDLFSMKFGSGYSLKRKEKDGSTVEWKEESAKLRIQLLPLSYLEREIKGTAVFNKFRIQ